MDAKKTNPARARCGAIAGSYANANSTAQHYIAPVSREINADDFAAIYAAHGWTPVAIAPSNKKPLLTGWQTRPLVETLAAISANQGANVGIAIPAGHMVLDVDCKGADGYASLAALETENGKLPNTLTAATPSGGLHIWFKLSPGVTVRNAVGFMPGLDVRSEGGYVVAPPSVIDGKLYVWRNWDGISVPNIAVPPVWLIDKIKRPAALALKATPGKCFTVPEGMRNHTLFKAGAAMARRGFDEDTISIALQNMNAKSCSPPLDDGEVTRVAASAARNEPEVQPWQIPWGGALPLGAHPVSPSAGFQTPEPITMGEWDSAKSTPPCVVQDYLFADVALLVSPGGVGKTTTILFEAVHIALGLPLYGLAIHKPGVVLIITAEDSREMLVARLRAIATAMARTPADVATVMQRVRIADVSGNGFKLTEVRGYTVMPSAEIDQIITACRILQPVLIVIDPAVSFGVGESRVNDAEQGLIEAARKLRKALNCCVRYIHHSGKANAREKVVDQYAGRGGSAFADGARMVHVLQSLTPDEWRKETGTELQPGESGLRLARPKMSYCAPVGDIFIRRSGYHFDHVERITTSSQAKLDMAATQVWQLLNFELSQGRYHSKNTLESLGTGLKRNEIRSALDWLLASRRIESCEISNAGKGGKRSYLHPIASPNGTANQSEKYPNPDEILAGEKSLFASPPPIGKQTAANLPPPFEPSILYGSPNTNGEATANLANQ